MMTNLFKNIVNAYKENGMEVLCGGLMMLGSANAYETYRMLRK
jgi:hypothetical protein